MFGNYYDNQQEGVWMCFWENGNPRVKISKKENLIEGPLTIYYETGEPMFSGIVEKGKEDVLLKKFMKHGKEIKTTKWSISEIFEVMPFHLN